MDVNQIPRRAWAFALLTLFTIAAAGAALDRVGNLARTAEHTIEDPFLLAAGLLEAHDGAYQLDASLHAMVMAGDNRARAAFAPALAEGERRLAAALATVVVPHKDHSELLAPLFASLNRWSATRARVLELVDEGRWADAHYLLISDGREDFDNLHHALNDILAAEQRRAAELTDATRRAERDATLAALGLAVAAGGALAALVVGFALFMRTHRPLMRLRGCLTALAAGDTGIHIPHRDQGDAIGALARAIAVFQQSVAERDAATSALEQSRERLREAVAEARRADACKGRFLASASHDLRQPFQALRLFLDVLDRRLDQPGDRLVLTGAMKALAAGEDVLRDYLDVSLLDSGIIQPVFREIAVGELLAELTLECAPAASAKNLTLRNVPSSAWVASDPHLLRRLLRNLLVNATRYTDQGGIVLGCRRRGDSLRIEVWDSGIGIAEDKLATVFEEFFQIGNPERDRAKGLGLGLSVVERLAALLGHRIDVASRPGKGSVFAVTVPLAPQPAARVAA